MAGFGRLERDPLFLALTRPVMVVGVTYSWFTFEGLIIMVTFINTAQSGGIFNTILLATVLHGVGFLACSHEPRFLDILKVNAQTNNRCTNKRFHSNTASYDLV